MLTTRLLSTSRSSHKCCLTFTLQETQFEMFAKHFQEIGNASNLLKHSRHQTLTDFNMYYLIRLSWKLCFHFLNAKKLKVKRGDFGKFSLLSNTYLSVFFTPAPKEKGIYCFNLVCLPVYPSVCLSYLKLVDDV